MSPAQIRKIELRRAYNRGYMAGIRRAKYRPRPTASPLARQVMVNEINRAKVSWFRQRDAMNLGRKLPQTGNELWQALGD